MRSDMKAKLKFIYSSMNSGKSLSLLSKNFMLREKGFHTVLMKPAIDSRSNDSITTRLGISDPCIVLELMDDPLKVINEKYNHKIDYILVDEAQFLTKEQVWRLATLVDEFNINVLCYGLKLNWQGEFFTGSEELMKIADELEPIETYCRYNKGARAFFHIKLGGSNDPVEIGEEDLYESVSRLKWKEWFSFNK
jgi:thymidine kinase